MTIKGWGFGAKRGTSKVTFGHKAVTKYVSWSKARIKVKVPAMSVGRKAVRVRTEDGRSNASKGLAMVPLSRLMAELGCQAAYNLDGGQSAMMYFRGAIITDPYKGGRSITDVVYIGE